MRPAGVLLLALTVTAHAQDELEEVVVEARRVVNEQPASTYGTVATALRFDPLVELQPRGLPEGQADVTVRGGLFENTGFRVGAVTITDPQTGHYFAELPVDPVALSAPEILQGVDNALSGFNSTIATVQYRFLPMSDGADVLLGVGTDALNYQSLRYATVNDADGTGLAFSAARSSGDGTVDNGDHEFARVNLHWQSRDDGAQTDAVVAFQDKFYGWPGAYTGFANLLETDDTQTTLVLVNHRREHARGFVELSAYHRRLVDDYDFDRTTSESGAPGSFDHETAVSAFGLQGRQKGGTLNWDYALQYTADELRESTDLINGDFRSRRYLKAALVPSWTNNLKTGREITIRAGLTLDMSDRDSNVANPVFGIELANTARGSRWSLDYVETSQMPGYTVLQSGASGLFGGNPDLGREAASQWSLSFAQDLRNGRWQLALFSREDDGLIDWTYSSASPFARQANAVDIDVAGLELLYRRSVAAFDVIAGLTLIDKDADYGSASVDASFYALNYAEQRLTLAFDWAIAPGLSLRMDNELREQSANPLRQSSASAYLGSLSLAWQPSTNSELRLVADNLSDEDFQFFPGTPAVGRQLSVSLRYRF